MLLACCLASPAGAAATPPTPAASAPAQVASSGDLSELSLDQLLNIEVTSVSKRAEPLSKAAAAIYVVTGEDIQRYGARSIAEALRLVPGMEVARSNANSYKISARGFNSSSDKLQVLIDGRSVYTPLTSAVFWDVLDTFLPDIDRIEVIRGPGATLWGANAVNGVVNIITKSSALTHGGELKAGGGNEERAFAALRTGTAIGEAGHARFYAQGFDRDNAKLASGADARDGQQHLQGGFRTDWTPTGNQQLGMSGDLYSGREHGTGASSKLPNDTDLSGANLTGHWSMSTAEHGTVSALLSFDQYQRRIPEAFSEKRDTYDLGVQHQIPFGERNEVIYGLGYRNTHDETGGPPLAIIFDPSSRTLETYSAFAQDQIRFADGAVVWTVGSKFEHNDFTGVEVQPGTRLGWQINPGWFTWGAVSRAVRTPNRVDSDLAIFCSAGIAPLLGCTAGTASKIGNPDFASEKLIAYEWGLRYSDNHYWSADLATYYNDYKDLRSIEKLPPPIGSFQNQLEGYGTGAELALTWKPVAAFDVRTSYGLLVLNMRAKPGSTDTNSAANIEGSSPRHQAGLRVSYEPAPRWNLAGFMRYVGRLARTTTPSATSRFSAVPAYTELNLRAAYRPWPALELALAGENLLDSQHPEFGATNTRSELQRSLLFDLTWSWQ